MKMHGWEKHCGTDRIWQRKKELIIVKDSEILALQNDPVESVSPLWASVLHL